MLVLVTYDIRTDSREGRRRLRRIAQACMDFGQRVQYPVFECDLDQVQWTALRARLCNLIDPQTDSLRFYMLGSNWHRRVAHVGAKAAVDFMGSLII